MLNNGEKSLRSILGFLDLLGMMSRLSQELTQEQNQSGQLMDSTMKAFLLKFSGALTSDKKPVQRMRGRFGLLMFACVLVGCASDPQTESASSSSPKYPQHSAGSSDSSPSLFSALLGESVEPQAPAGTAQTPLLPRLSIDVDQKPATVHQTIEAVALDVGIVAFQPLMSSLQRAQSPLVRKAEARYLPYVLKQTLERTSRWGVVRVMPGQHGSAELNVEGELLVSDGERLVLRIKARDSAERLWLDREYRMAVSERAYEKLGQEPFQAMFNRIEADLYQAYSLLDRAQQNQLSSLAVLTYGDRLLPDGFSRYYQKSAQGVSVLQGLPAESDPMYRRVQQLRRYEYFFVDTADEQYQSLFASMQRTYHHWRQYSRELVVYMRDYQARQAGQSSGYRRGSLAAMNEVYSDYEWFRMQERYLKELSSGFNNQVLPTVLNLDDQVVHLEGGYDDQYQQWQQILSEIYQLEHGVN